MKKGRLSKKEQQFIEQHCEAMPCEEIAKELDRDPVSIQNFIKNKLGRGMSKKEKDEFEAAYDLKSRPYWLDLKAQFNTQELEMFVLLFSLVVSFFLNVYVLP